MMDQFALEMRGITKEFPGVRALDGVTFQVQPGEIHGLIGENGAGKSTLMKIMSGFYPAGTYSGDLVVGGRPVTFQTIGASEAAGIAIIYQELALVKEMSVAENIFLGHEPTRFGIIQFDKLYADATRWLAEVGLDVDPTTPVKQLGVGKQQLIEIAKALAKNASILILDEPSAALTETEVATLLQILRQLRTKGVSCVYISHKLNEIFAIADRVTVLRDGRTVATHSVGELTEERVISLMVGRELTDRFPREERLLGHPVLEVNNLVVHRADGSVVVGPVSLMVRSGEILGISGLMGAGRTEMVTALFGGWEGLVTGDCFLEGMPLTGRSPQSALAAGIAMVTEDRKRLGLVLGMDVKSNVTLAGLKQLSKLGVIDQNEEILHTRQQVADLKVKTSSLEAEVSTLSGGNQQKVVLGKMLLLKPKVLILDEPTRGIDVGAKYEIYKIMNQLARAGVAIIMVSSELPEVMGMSDRILVMHEGAITGEFRWGEATRETIMHAATGRRSA
jgi:D-xylose transport system ATP-binding protein